MSEQQLVLMRMPLGPLGTNCYVIGDKAIGEAFIIDPATAEVLDALKKYDLKPKAVVLTHGHGRPYRWGTRDCRCISSSCIYS